MGKACENYSRQVENMKKRSSWKEQTIKKNWKEKKKEDKKRRRKGENNLLMEKEPEKRIVQT